MLNLPALGGSVNSLLGLLSPDERERGARLRRIEDRDRFVIVRGELRRFLGGLLGEAPETLFFSYGVHGKPGLAPGHARQEGADRLYFNVAHTEGWAVIAACWGLEIGIDIERVRPWEAAGKIARRFFSPNEQAALNELPESIREKAFFTAWTRKEAVLKAMGSGLVVPLRSFTVTLDRTEPPRVIEMIGDPAAPARWQLVDLAVPEPYVAALAAQTNEPLQVIVGF